VQLTPQHITGLTFTAMISRRFEVGHLSPAKYALDPLEVRQSCNHLHHP